MFFKMPLPQPSTSREDPILQLLSGGSRRTSTATAAAAAVAAVADSADLLGVVLEALTGCEYQENGDRWFLYLQVVIFCVDRP